MIVIFLFVIIQFIPVRLIGRRLLKDKRCAKRRTTAFPCQKSDKICQFGRIACEELTKQTATQTRTVHCFRKASSDKSRDHKQGSLRFPTRKRAFPGKETGVSKQGNRWYQRRKPQAGCPIEDNKKAASEGKLCSSEGGSTPYYIYVIP